MSKLVIIAILALVAYNVVTGTDLIKNSGLLNLQAGAGPQAPKTTGGVNTAPKEHPAVKRTSHAQIEDAHDGNPGVLPHPQMSNNFAAQGNFKPSTEHNQGQLDCFPKDQVQPQELLPREGGFSDSNPTPQGHLSNQNFFESGHHPGLNTQSSTLKNPNLQLRSDPLIPRRDVGPWHQSTIEADTNRRQFEIGGI